MCCVVLVLDVYRFIGFLNDHFSSPEHYVLCYIVGGRGAHRFFLGEKRGVCAVSRLWFLLGD